MISMETADDYQEFPFVGRADALAELDRAWKENQHRIFGVYGLRSLGKSRTVREFLKRQDEAIKLSLDQGNTESDLKVIPLDMTFIGNKVTLFSQLCAGLGILHRNLFDLKTIFDTLVNEICNNFNFLYVFIFESAEKTFEVSLKNSETGEEIWNLKDDLQTLCVDLVSACRNVRIFLTSTTHILFAQINKAVYKCELKPMSKEDSVELLATVAPDMHSHECTDKIVDLCCGLPLALIIVGSNLTVDGIQDPWKYVESLTVCRLKALSNTSHKEGDSLEYLYRQFLLKLTDVFQQRLAVLGFIPGSFNDKQAAEILDDKASVAEMKSMVLLPLKRKSMLLYDQDTRRLNIHGILRDCLDVYTVIEELPRVRKSYCRIFKEEMEKISRKIDSREYKEALAAFSFEYPNLQKLLRLLSVLEHNRDETYPFLIQISARCSSLIEKFLSAESETFYQCALRLAAEYGQVQDGAIVRIAYGSMLTMSKGDFSSGETHYQEALKVLKTQKSTDLGNLYYSLAYNLYYQWRGEEAYRNLQKSLEILEEMGQINTDMGVQVFNLLGRVLTLNGKYVEGEIVLFDALKRGEEKLGKDHPLNGSTMNNLGVFYEQLGDGKNALLWHERALEAKRKINAPPKSLYASLTNTALQYSEIGEHSKAEQLLKEAKDILYQGIPNNAAIGAMYDNFGQVYFNQKKYDKALVCIKTALDIRAQVALLNGLQLSHAESLAFMSKIYVTIGDYESAIQPAKTVLAWKEKMYRRLPQVRYIYQSLKCLLTAYSELGRKDEVQELYKDMEVELIRLISVFQEQHNLTRVEQFRQKLAEHRSSSYVQAILKMGQLDLERNNAEK
ncbi:hypothetical protein ACJMK2_027980 [Sinanodonta woodiana]|uniref:Uncharacterized protein n=1 Tax=Sinanodonta woodiana TaxID=1069815 RepID=A0ABD3X5N9_SINWO